jgi:hypothetical protein
MTKTLLLASCRATLAACSRVDEPALTDRVGSAHGNTRSRWTTLRTDSVWVSSQGRWHYLHYIPVAEYNAIKANPTAYGINRSDINRDGNCAPPANDCVDDVTILPND